MKTKTTEHTTPKNINFVLMRKQVKNIGLKVRNTGVVQVTAHNRVPLEYIINLVDEKSEWINKHLEKFKNVQNSGGGQQSKTPLTYNTGEAVRYLGEEYVLVVTETTTNKVYIENKTIHLNVKADTTFEKKEQMLEKWYKEQCSNVFQQVLDTEYEKVKDYILGQRLQNKPTIKLRKMKSCWGVCHYTKGHIVLNTELIKYDMECIEYVVLHELIHFRHQNHSKDFYDGLTYFMKDYKEIKSRLKAQY